MDVKSYLLEGYYRCKDCDFENRNPERLISHLNNRTDITFDCDICGKKYCTLIGLRYHISRKHGVPKEEKFQCDLCDSAFVTRFALKRHQKFKHKETQTNHSIPMMTAEGTCYFQ